MARLMTSGMVKMLKDVTMGNPQPSPKFIFILLFYINKKYILIKKIYIKNDKYKHGCSSQTKRWWGMII